MALSKRTHRMLIGAVVLLAMTGVLVAKALRRERKDESAVTVRQEERAGAPTAYLFFNSKDQDAGCQTLYGLFDKAASLLPPGVAIIRVDVNDTRDDLFEKFAVRVLPSVLLVDGAGAVKVRIDGEGSDAERRIEEAFAGARSMLNL